MHGVRSMLDLYDGGHCWEEVLTLARAERQRGWWRAYGVGDDSYVGFETEAVTVSDFTIDYIPGLLQVLPSAVPRRVVEGSGFTVLGFGDLGEPDLAYVEHALGALMMDKEADVARARLGFDRLRSDALRTPAPTATAASRWRRCPAGWPCATPRTGRWPRTSTARPGGARSWPGCARGRSTGPELDL